MELEQVHPTYKIVKEPQPHCPLCKERLLGNNSIVLPYRCSCGTWVRDMQTMKFIITPHQGN